MQGRMGMDSSRVLNSNEAAASNEFAVTEAIATWRQSGKKELRAADRRADWNNAVGLCDSPNVLKLQFE
jgi:hypothetical protein